GSLSRRHRLRGAGKNRRRPPATERQPLQLLPHAGEHRLAGFHFSPWTAGLSRGASPRGEEPRVGGGSAEDGVQKARAEGAGGRRRAVPGSRPHSRRGGGALSVGS